MVNIANDTKLFTPRNISKFAKEKAKLLYAILAEAIPGTDNEHSTIGIALTPEDAMAFCEECMGDAIEVWVIEGDRGIRSEKWEPKYFKEHFGDIVECTQPEKVDTEGNDDFDIDALLNDSKGEMLSDGVNEPETHAGGIGLEMPQEVIMGKSLLEILEFEQSVAKGIAATSYMTGHPIDINTLLENMHASILAILTAFAQSKGGFEPKFRKKDGILVPYWTKTQIKQAKLKG